MKYKRRYKLEPDDATFAQIAALAQIQCTQREAAAVLGVAHTTFENFLANNADAKAAWQDGKQTGRASLRRLLWKQAQTDEGQARFLAKDKRWLQMEDSTPVVNLTVNNVTIEERKKRVIELQNRVLTIGTDLVPSDNT